MPSLIYQTFTEHLLHVRYKNKWPSQKIENTMEEKWKRNERFGL